MLRRKRLSELDISVESGGLATINGTYGSITDRLAVQQTWHGAAVYTVIHVQSALGTNAGDHSFKVSFCTLGRCLTRREAADAVKDRSQTCGVLHGIENELQPRCALSVCRA